jgi:hypothetical protein
VGCSLTSWYAAASVTLGALGKPDIDNGGSTRWAVRSLPGTLPPLLPWAPWVNPTSTMEGAPGGLFTHFLVRCRLCHPGRLG